ncbi:hypothetical protein GpartN1_g6565.t1 [Galdieria partita]|uniref:PWWP domain-containing protein n=1 Tax=Galdieria partita TaxID=83374 RepID=A0A9C7Q1U4_9RHOD|nr:hypothetical protein GpartN1_g6565.t1 [Galdieria partita]
MTLENVFLYKGAVVWAKVYGYPWWPASITTDQRSGKWFHKGKYWVYFFNDPQGAWLKPNCLKEFNDANIAALTPKENHRYYKQIVKAVEEAKEVHSNVLPPEQVAALAQARTEEDNVDNAANATTEEEEDGSEEEKETSNTSQEKIDEPYKANSQRSSRSSSRKRKLEYEDNSQGSKKQLCKMSVDSKTSAKNIRKGFRYRDLVFQMPIDRPYHELDPSYLENPQSLNTNAEELQTEVEHLQQLSSLFCSKSDEMKSIQEALMKLSDQINEKIRQFERHCDELYSIEGQILQSLKALFQSRVTITMLKNSRAGKPVVEVEKSCGPNSHSIRTMSKQLVRQWKKMVMESTPLKKDQETAETKRLDSEEGNGKENSSSKEATAVEDATTHPTDSFNHHSEDQMSSSQENGKEEPTNSFFAEDNLNFAKYSSNETEEGYTTRVSP